MGIILYKTFEEAITSSTLVFDGATGTEIYRRHIFTNQCYDELNIRNRGIIKEIATSYGIAGVDVLTANTYGANRFALERYGEESQVVSINQAGVEITREVATEYSTSNHKIFVAGSVGFPSDEILKKRKRIEIGDCFAEQIYSLVESGVDLIIFESQPTRETAEVMVDAIQQVNVQVPFIISYALSPSLFAPPHTLETRARIYAKLFTSFCGKKFSPVAWGLNCGLGPKQLLQAVQETIKTLKRPLVVQPNAGIPQKFEGRQLYYNTPDYIATYAKRYVELGAAAVGGCCGISSIEITEIVKRIKNFSQCKKTKVILSGDQFAINEQKEVPLETRSQLAHKLHNKSWVQTVETIPPLGYELGSFLDKIKILQDNGIDAVNLPDGPRASARISSIVAAQYVIANTKIEPILHVCCRDRNLIALQADLLGCAALNIKNLLFITGDPPKLGLYPNATGVFDCDSIGLCTLQQRLNRGIDLVGQPIGLPTRAFFGCGIDPSALNRDRELERLRKKIDAGAQFIVTQPVFDPDVLLQFLDDFGNLDIPVIAGIWPFVSYRNALFMRKEVPGVIVPDRIMQRMEKASSVSKEVQLTTGIEIARESLSYLRSRVQGIQVSAPLGRIDVSLKVIENC